MNKDIKIKKILVYNRFLLLYLIDYYILFI